MSVARPLDGFRIGVTAARKAEEQVALLRRRGACVEWAAALSMEPNHVDLGELLADAAEDGAAGVPLSGEPAVGLALVAGDALLPADALGDVLAVGLGSADGEVDAVGVAEGLALGAGPESATV